MSKTAAKLRTPPAIQRAIARLRVLEGRTKTAIARELGIDRQTVTRNLRAPVTQAEVRRLKLEREGAVQSPPPVASPTLPHNLPTAPTPAGRHYKVPLDIVPLETRRITYWEIKAGRINPDTVNPVLLAALEEYNPNDPNDCPATAPAPAQHGPSRRPSRAFEEFIDAVNGIARRSSDGRRRVCSVPPRLRPQPNLDW